MILSELLFGIEYSNKEVPNIEIETVTAKQNEITNNTLFIFLKGIKFNTLTILSEIVEKKPAVIISDTNLQKTADIPIIYVKNARMAYSYIMWNFCKIDGKKTEFYAVTGTNGKTTTATMLFNIFSTAKIKSGFIGTGKIIIGTDVVSEPFYSMTTPDPDVLYPIIKRMQDSGCERIVMEVSSHALSLFKVSPITFECSMFTNLSEEHMDFHSSIEEYFNTKLSLFRQSKCAVFNLDDEYGKKAMIYSNDICETYGVAIRNDADAIAKDITNDAFESVSYIYRERNSIFKINLFTIGEYNVLNSLLAIKCALLSGIDNSIVKESFNYRMIIDGRCEIISREPMVIIDYAHTCAALEKVLKTIKTIKNKEQNIFTVFGCGGERDKTKRPKMAEVSELYSDFSIVTSDNARSENASEIIAEIIKGFKSAEKHAVIENRKAAIEYAISNAQKKDIILIIGKGHERYNIDAEGYHSFDERKIITEAIKEKKAAENENKNRASANTFYDRNVPKNSNT